MKKSEKPMARLRSRRPPPYPEEAIRQRAYELYEQRGRVDRHAVEDWLTAEAEVWLKSKGAAA